MDSKEPELPFGPCAFLRVYPCAHERPSAKEAEEPRAAGKDVVLGLPVCQGAPVPQGYLVDGNGEGSLFLGLGILRAPVAEKVGATQDAEEPRPVQLLPLLHRQVVSASDPSSFSGG